MLIIATIELHSFSPTCWKRKIKK